MNFSVKGTGPLDDALRALASRRPKLIDLSLGRVETVLERLDRPQDRLPPTFHVAGTNGKGSTVAFLRAIIEASGTTAHVYTSPHLVRYNERIVLAGEEVTDDAFVAALRTVDAAAGTAELTFFETLTCAAFVMFAATPADFLVLEVGLGGRLDATNVLAAPLAAVVTAIGLDHQAYLGDTRAAIAREKAGIFKSGRPAVIAAQEPDAMAALLDAAQAANARAFAFGSDWMCWEESGRLVYQDDLGLSDLDRPRLIGPHQIANAGLAVAAIRAAGLRIDNATLSRGLAGATWPARMQRFDHGPLAVRLGAEDPAAGREVWLDGGHNPDAAVVIAQTLADLGERSPKPLVMIVGMQSTKDADGFFRPFNGLVRHVIATAADTDLAAPPDIIAAAATRAGLAASTAPTLAAALAMADASAAGPTRFLIAGSLYLAGDALVLHRHG